MKYYKIILDGYDKKGGVIYTPEDIRLGIIEDAKEVDNSIYDMKFTLKDGEYTHFMGSNFGNKFISKELKELIENYIPKEYPLVFVPVHVYSNLYGNKDYFILHFDIIFDVLDRDNCIYLPDTGDICDIVKPCFSLEKIKNLNIFNSRPIINDINVSDKLRKDMKKHKMDMGIEFLQVRCV